MDKTYIYNELVGHNHEGYTPIANSIWSRKLLLGKINEEVAVDFEYLEQRLGMILVGDTEHIGKVFSFLIFAAQFSVSSMFRNERGHGDTWNIGEKDDFKPVSINENMSLLELNEKVGSFLNELERFSHDDQLEILTGIKPTKLEQ
jgi:hypothetical protein